MVYNPEKLREHLPLSFVKSYSRHKIWRYAFMFSVWFHAWYFLYVTSRQKQIIDVSLVLKDSDMDSENLSNLSLLIRLSVSDGQKADSSKVVSFIGI